MKLLSKLSTIRPLILLPILIFVQFFQTLDACCGGGCGCGCSYGCYQPQQQTVQVQQQPIYIPYPVPVNNNNNNGAAARSYRNYVNGVGTGNNNNNNGNSNNRPTNTNANTDQAQTNALLASLVTQLQRSNALNSANTNNNNNNGNAGSGSGGTSYSNNNAMKALQEAANQQQQQQKLSNSNTVNNANNNQNALLALLAQLQQLQQPPPPTTVKTTTTTTTTTTTQKTFSFDLGAALQSLLSHLPVPPPPTTTTTTTTPAPTTPKPILLSAEQVDQLRNILAAIGGSAAQQNDQAQRAHVAPKGLAALIAQDANGGAAPPPPSDSDDDEYDEDDDVDDEEFDHPPGYGRAHPMTSRLMTMLHMADALDQVTAISAPEIAHARPISSRIVGMINPDAANVTSDSDSAANGPSSPLGPVSRPLINMNIPIPPSERDPSIIRGNIFAWENGALSVGDMGIFDGRFIKADIGGFEKLNPAPEESGDDEDGELDEDQLHGVLMDFYYKFDTYDARDSIEHADLGDEAFAEIQKETESAEKEK